MQYNHLVQNYIRSIELLIVFMCAKAAMDRVSSLILSVKCTESVLYSYFQVRSVLGERVG